MASSLSFEKCIAEYYILPISSSLASKYSTSIVAKVAEVAGLARNVLATICRA